jgi:hypothetical protein
LLRLFTPTEAGAVIVGYAPPISAFAWSAIDNRTESALATATVMIIISAADAFSHRLSAIEGGSIPYVADPRHQCNPADLGMLLERSRGPHYRGRR